VEWPEGEASIPELLRRNVTSRPEQPALLPAGDDASYSESVSWADLGQRVASSAVALRGYGAGAGDRVASIAENSIDWIALDLAILLLRAVHVPIHATHSPSQIAEQIRHSESRLALFGPTVDMQAAGRSGDLPAEALTFDSFVAAVSEQGMLDRDGSMGILAEAEQCEPDSLATIMYTSGTTGRPRGVMLSHRNLASNAIATADAYVPEPNELRFCFLPLSHIYARTCDMYVWLYRGSRLALARSRETLLTDIRAAQPTHVNGVPYFYEKLVRGLQASESGDAPGGLRAALGGRIRHCFAGGAAMAREVEDYFRAQDVPLLPGYGLTESSPVITLSTPAANRPGTVGRPIRGVEIKCAEDGEIFTRGPHVMLGYWRDEAATKEVIHDRWLATGDLGRIDQEGFLTITGRKKELIVTTTGKNVAPSAIETRLTASPLIAQAMVVGEGRSYLAALIVPEPEALRTLIKRKRLWVFSRRGALRHRQVLAHYRGEIDHRLSGLARHEQIGRFVLLPRGFSVEQGELTPKASLRRDAIANHFAPDINRLYRSSKAAR